MCQVAFDQRVGHGHEFLRIDRYHQCEQSQYGSFVDVAWRLRNQLNHSQSHQHTTDDRSSEKGRVDFE